MGLAATSATVGRLKTTQNSPKKDRRKCKNHNLGVAGAMMDGVMAQSNNYNWTRNRALILRLIGIPRQCTSKASGPYSTRHQALVYLLQGHDKLGGSRISMVYRIV